MNSKETNETKLIVLGGLGVAGALYFVTRKKAKLYHV